MSRRCQRQDYWPFFAIFNVRYWSLMLSAFRHFIITDWRGVFCQHSRFAFFLLTGFVDRRCYSDGGLGFSPDGFRLRSRRCRNRGGSVVLEIGKQKHARGFEAGKRAMQDNHGQNVNILSMIVQKRCFCLCLPQALYL